MPRVQTQCARLHINHDLVHGSVSLSYSAPLRMDCRATEYLGTEKDIR